LKGNPPSWNESDGSKSHSEGLLGFISKGEVEKDGIGSIIIVPGEEDLVCPGKGNSQIDLFAPLPFLNRKVNVFFLNP
jgi:hypothetical protein